MPVPPEPNQAPNPAPESRPSWRRTLVGAAVIILAVFAVYWPAMRGEFLWDDFLVIHRNPLVTGELAPGAIWFHMDFPLTYVAFWLQWLVWGTHSVGFHVVNVFLHATGALLLWRVLVQLKVPLPWLAAMIFAVHPVCVASVAWISELKNTLSLPFFLLSLLLYLQFDSALRPSTLRSNVFPPQSCPPSAVLPRRTGYAGRATEDGSAFGIRPSLLYFLSLVAFLLALLSKTSTVMLPFILVGCAWWQRGRITRRDFLRASPYFALALAFGLMTISFQAQGAIAGATVQTENLWGRLAGAGMALWFYLGKAVLPLHLCMIYPRWQISPSAPLSYLPLLLWCAALIACWPSRRTWGRHVLFGLGCFTLTLLPVLGFIDMFFLKLSRVSDHFEYLPLTALVALVAGALGCWCRSRGLRQFLGAGLVVGLAVLSFQRAHVFQNEEALWRDTLLKNPAVWSAHANLGRILAEQRKFDEARQHLTTSLELNPDNAQALSNLGRLLSLQHQFAQAETNFQAALKLKPKDPDIRKSYAAALAEQGRPQEAAAQLAEVLRLHADTDARLQLAALQYQLRKFAEAVAQYREVLAAKPDQPDALNNLAWLLATSSDAAVRNGPEAIQLAQRACRLSGYHQARALGALAAAYAEAGRFPEAVEAQQKSIDAAKAAGNSQLATIGSQLLALFRAGLPYHEPAPTPAPHASP